MSKILVTIALSLLAACLHVDDGADSRVDAPRIIAVVPTPPEGTPGSMVHYDAIVAAPIGSVTPPLAWSFCNSARAPTDNTSVAPACAQTAQLPLPAAGTSVDATLPSNACVLFGSQPPAGRQPNRPDATGGYYQPLRVAFAGSIAIERQRVRCPLPSATVDVARAYTQQYTANQAPRITAFHALVAGGEVDPSALPMTSHLDVRVDIDPASREAYLFYDVHRGALTTQTELLSTTWFVTGARFQQDMVDVADVTADNVLELPDDLADATVWVVLRDDRGGVAVHTQALHRR